MTFSYMSITKWFLYNVLFIAYIEGLIVAYKRYCCKVSWLLL